MDKFEYVLSKKNGVLEKRYAEEINKRIRSRYTQSDELAILRQRDCKPDEFAEYNAYAESCKKAVKEEFALLEMEIGNDEV